MKIHIDNASQDKRIFEGEYQYLEDLAHGEKPSFFICVSGEKADYEIHFNLDNKEELQDLIKNLEDLKKSE
jgi:hypothetical protein